MDARVTAQMGEMIPLYRAAALAPPLCGDPDPRPVAQLPAQVKRPAGTPAGTLWRRVTRAARRRCRRAPFATALGALALGSLISWYWAPDPAKTGFTHLRTMPFYSAMLVAMLLAGRGAAWTVAIGALLLQAIVLWSSATAARYVPFLAEFVITMTIATAVVSFIDGERVRSKRLTVAHRPSDAIPGELAAQ